MERREFVSTVAGMAAVPLVGRAAWSVRRSDADPSTPHAARNIQGPALGPEVFAKRLEKLQAEMKTRKFDLYVAEPSTNFQYLTGYNPGRSERLILLMVPQIGAPRIICPSFEVERIKRNTAIGDARGWEEQENPWGLVKQGGRDYKTAHRNGPRALEPTTSYQSYLHLDDKLGSWKFENGAVVTERLRIVKGPEEIALIRQAIAATQASIAATFTQLQVGMSERDVADLLSREMASRGSPGGGLVQFGPSSALPHGGHPPHDRVRRCAVGRVQEGLQHRPRRPDCRGREREAVHHAVPGSRPRRAQSHHRRRLRPILPPPPRPRHGHGRTRAALHGRGERNADRAGDGFHRRAGDLPAQQVRRADRRRLRHDGKRPGVSLPAGDETLVAELSREADDAV